MPSWSPSIGRLPEPLRQPLGLDTGGQARPLAQQLPRGRLIELTAARACGQMTTAVTCLLHAQQQGETTAWVQLQGGSLYPPDLAASGIDLEALILVQVPKSAGAHGIGKAAELLLRSGGFGFLVLDLVGAFSYPAARHDLAFQGRLLGLVREHDSTLVLLTEANAHGSFGPLVSICIEPQRTRSTEARFSIVHRVRKDKTGSLCTLTEEPARELF